MFSQVHENVWLKKYAKSLSEWSFTETLPVRVTNFFLSHERFLKNEFELLLNYLHISNFLARPNVRISIKRTQNKTRKNVIPKSMYSKTNHDGKGFILIWNSLKIMSTTILEHWNMKLPCCGCSFIFISKYHDPRNWHEITKCNFATSIIKLEKWYEI